MMNFIVLELKNGREALINLDNVAYITENSDYDTTVAFVDSRQNLVLDERYENVISCIESRQRRNK